MRLIILALLLSGCANQIRNSSSPCSVSRPALNLKFSSQPKFLVAGQSNAVSPSQGLHVPYYSQTGLTAVTDVYGTGTLRIPTAANPVDSSIAWIYLGDAMNKSVSFTNVAQGNTSTGFWVSTLYNAKMKPALQADTFDAVLWVQGESDIGEHFTEEQTYTNMRTIILASRTIQPGLPWFIALNSAYNAGSDNSVRQAQCRIINDGLAYAGPDTDVLRLTQSYVEVTRNEFAGAGLEQHGLLWFATLRDYL